MNQILKITGDGRPNHQASSARFRPSGGPGSGSAMANVSQGCSATPRVADCPPHPSTRSNEQSASVLSMRQCQRSQTVLDRRSSDMLSEPMNYDLPLSSSRMAASRVNIPECGASFSNPVTQTQSKTTTAKNTPMNSLQNTMSQNAAAVRVPGRRGDELPPATGPTLQQLQMKQLQLQKMQQSLYVGLTYREIDENEDENDPDSQNSQLEDQQKGPGAEGGVGVVDGRFDTEAMERCISKVNLPDYTGKNTYNGLMIREHQKRMDRVNSKRVSSRSRRDPSSRRGHSSRSRRGPSSRRDQQSSERLDTHYFHDNQVPTQQSVRELDHVLVQNPHQDLSQMMRDESGAAFAQEKGKQIQGSRFQFQDDYGSSLKCSGTTQNPKATLKSSELSSINDNYQFLSGVQDIESNIKEDVAKQAPDDYLLQIDKGGKKRKSRFVSLDGPGQTVKMPPTLPSESTQGINNLLNTKGQIILSGNNNQQFMLVPINNKPSSLSPVNQDYSDQTQMLPIGTSNSLQSKSAAQQYQMISFGPEEGQLIRLHSQSTPRMKFTGGSGSQQSSLGAFPSVLHSKQKLNKLHHLTPIDVDQKGGGCLTSAKLDLCLANIAEKLCMRMAAREVQLGAQQVLNFLDIQNQQLCVVLNDEDNINQKLQKLVEALNENNDRSKKISQGMPELLNGKCNLDIIQDVKDTFQKIVDVQLSISQKDNIYLKYASEVERNQLLREELESHDLLLQTKDREIDHLLQGIGAMKRQQSMQTSGSLHGSHGKRRRGDADRLLQRSRSVPPECLAEQELRGESGWLAETGSSHLCMPGAPSPSPLDGLRTAGRMSSLEADRRPASSLSASKMRAGNRGSLQCPGAQLLVQRQTAADHLEQHRTGLEKKLIDDPLINDFKAQIPHSVQQVIDDKDRQIDRLNQQIDQLRNELVYSESIKQSQLQEQVICQLSQIQSKVESLTQSQVFKLTSDEKDLMRQLAGAPRMYNAQRKMPSRDRGDNADGEEQWNSSKQSGEASLEDSDDIVSKSVDIYLPQPTELDEEPYLMHPSCHYLDNSQTKSIPSSETSPSKNLVYPQMHNEMRPIEVNTASHPQEFQSFQSQFSKLTGPYIQTTIEPSPQHMLAAGIFRQITDLQDQVKTLVVVVKDLKGQVQVNHASDECKGGTLLQDGGRTAQFNAGIHTKCSPSQGWSANSGRRHIVQSSRSSNKLEHTFQLRKRSHSQLTCYSSRPSVAQNKQCHGEPPSSEIVPYTARPEPQASHHISHGQLAPLQTHRQPNHKEQAGTHRSTSDAMPTHRSSSSVGQTGAKESKLASSFGQVVHLRQLPLRKLSLQQPPIKMSSTTSKHFTNGQNSSLKASPTHRLDKITQSSLQKTQQSRLAGEQQRRQGTSQALALDLLQQEISRLRQSNLQTVENLQKAHRANVEKLSGVIKILEGKLTQMNGIVYEQKKLSAQQQQKSDALIKLLRQEIEQKSNLLRAQTKDLKAMKEELDALRSDNSRGRAHLQQMKDDLAEKEKVCLVENHKFEEDKIALMNSLKEQDIARKIDEEIWAVEQRDLREQVQALQLQLEAERMKRVDIVRETEERDLKNKKTIEIKSGEILELKDWALSLKIQLGQLEKQTEQDIKIREEAWKNDLDLVKKNLVNTNGSVTQPLGTTTNSISTSEQLPKASAVLQNTQSLHTTFLAEYDKLRHSYEQLGTLANVLCLQYQDKKLEERLMSTIEASKQLQEKQEYDKQQLNDELMKSRLKVTEYKQIMRSLMLILGQKDDLIESMKQFMGRNRQELSQHGSIIKSCAGTTQVQKLAASEPPARATLQNESERLPSFRIMACRRQTWAMDPTPTGMAFASDSTLSVSMVSLVDQLKASRQTLQSLLEKKAADLEDAKLSIQKSNESLEGANKQNIELGKKVDALEAEKGSLWKCLDSVKDALTAEGVEHVIAFLGSPSDYSHKIRLLIDERTDYKKQWQFSQEENVRLQEKISSQRELLQGQIDSLEKELQNQNERHIKALEEASLANCQKEKELEERLQDALNELAQVKKSHAYLERQENKHDQQRKYEHERQEDLQNQIDFLKKELMSSHEKHDREKNLNMDLSVKIKKTEDALDKKIQMIDQLQTDNLELGRTRKENEELRLKSLKLEGEVKLLQESRLSRLGLPTILESAMEQTLAGRGPSSQSVNINNDAQMESIIKDRPRTQQSFHNKENMITAAPQQLRGTSISTSVINTSQVSGLTQSEQISHLIAQIRHQDQKMSELQARNSELEQRANQAQEHEDEVKQMIEHNQLLIEKVKQAEHEALVQKDQSVQHQIDYQKYQDSIRFLQQKHDEGQHKIAELSQSLAEAESKLQALQNVLKNTADDVRACVAEAYCQTQTSLGADDNDLVPESDRACEKKLKRENVQLAKKLEEVKQQKKDYKSEVRSSREAIARYKVELHSLQKEKRELMKQINQLNAQLRLKLSLFDGEMVEYKLTSTNSEPHTFTYRYKEADQATKKAAAIPKEDDNQLKQILQEKDKYVGKIEEENGKLRIDNAELKDRLIQCEIDNIGNRK